MTQNETQELATLSEGVAGLLRRRRGLGLRRTRALPNASPRPTISRGGQATSTPPPSAPAAAPPAAGPPAAPSAERPAARSTPPAAPAAAPGNTAPDTSGYRSLGDLARGISECRACGLGHLRRTPFALFGSASSGVLFIDEMPGESANAGGSPFEGASGELLGNIIIKGMGLDLDAVGLISLVKCQPGGGAPPEPGELSTCSSWLNRQLELLTPKVIVTLGRPAAAAVLGVDEPLGRLRGQAHAAFGSQVVTTFHPNYLVRSPQYKKAAWEDIQLAMGLAGIPLPPRK